MISLHEDREDKLERSALNLTDSDPLKRLISVRQLTKLATQQLKPDEKKYVIQCLQLLLTNELEEAIRDAAFDSLQALEPAEKPIAKSNSTTLIPFSVKAKNQINGVKQTLLFHSVKP